MKIAIALVTLVAALPTSVRAEPAAAVARELGARAVVTRPVADGAGTALGVGFDVKLGRGRFFPIIGGTAAIDLAETGNRFWRVEASMAAMVAGPVYAGVGGGLGLMDVVTPGQGSGSWSGLSAATFGLAGLELATGDLRLYSELRAAVALGIGSLDPTETTPAAATRPEVSVSLGARW